MNAWTRLWNSLTNRVTRPDPSMGSRVVYGGRSASGIYVDAQSSLKNATVWACVQYLSRTVAQLPWRVMQELPQGGARTVPTNPADYLIHRRPNPEMGSFTFRQTLMGSALTYGNGYAEIEWDNRGAPYALWPIRSDRVTPRRNEDGVLEYEVWGQSGRTVLAARDMLHIRGFGDGVVGYNVIEYAAQTIGWAQATETFGATFFGEGMNPSGVIKVKQSLSPGAMEVLRESLDKMYKGPRGQRTAILDADMDFSRVATNPDEAQFIESMQHQVEAICRWFAVPPHKVMHLLRAHFTNIEHQSIEVVVDSITPWAKIWEEEADYKLFGANRQNLHTKMNLRGLMRGDNASRAAYYKTMFELGVTINQILAFEDMPGIGADGDVQFVSNNVQTLERAIAGAPKPTAGPAQAMDPDPPVAASLGANGARIAH
jgi:HK97 family phage portal protein